MGIALVLLGFILHFCHRTVEGKTKSVMLIYVFCHNNLDYLGSKACHLKPGVIIAIMLVIVRIYMYFSACLDTFKLCGNVGQINHMSSDLGCLWFACP